jgi:hypothetical protein
MAEECVVAMYDTVAQASDALQALTDFGFPYDQVSLVTKTLKLEADVRDAIEFR